MASGVGNVSSLPLQPIDTGFLRVAVVGCSHGELDAIYAAAAAATASSSDSRPVDLVICCGDFQAVRNGGDLACMACPPKYRAMHTFWQLYAGLAEAPIPTLFIGGNHEASNHSSELPFGGWAARRVWFMGSAGVVNFGGIRIGGVSGIYKSPDFNSGYFEKAPYAGSGQVHSSGHQRAFDFWRLGALAGSPPGPLDIFLSHDWPEGVYRYGDTEALLRNKPFFRDDISRGALGSPPSAALLNALKPRFWFSGHLHTKFAALVPHADGSITRFLALDKPIPGRAFLQVLDIPRSSTAASVSTRTELESPFTFSYDPLWVAVAVKAHPSTPTGSRASPLPITPPLPTVAEISRVASALAAHSARKRGCDISTIEIAARDAGNTPLAPIQIPDNFIISAPLHNPHHSNGLNERMPTQQGNPQTDELFHALGIEHVTTVPFGAPPGWVPPPLPSSSSVSSSIALTRIPLALADSGVAAEELREFQAKASAAFASTSSWIPSLPVTTIPIPVPTTTAAAAATDANEINLDNL